MNKPRALDLFCGAGGVSMGLHRAGFSVTGVDMVPQKHYPFEFILEDALSVDCGGYDFVWASPPCQGFSIANLAFIKSGKRHYPNLIPGTRNKLTRTEKPWIMENVSTAPLRNAVMLCGTMFGLGVFRHRHFESNVDLVVPQHKKHEGKIGDGEYFSIAGGCGRWKTWGKVVRNVSKGNRADWRKAMEIDWMDLRGLRNAIPPAYSEFLGRQIITHLNK